MVRAGPTVFLRVNIEDLNGGSTTQLIYLNTNDVWLETAATWNTAAPYNTVSIATGTFDPLKGKDIDAEGIKHTYDVTNAVKNESGGMISFRVAFDETVTDSQGGFIYYATRKIPQGNPHWS